MTAREELLRLAGEFRDDFATRAAEHDRDASYPFENFEKLREQNCLSLPLPEEWGGRGVGIHDYSLFARKISEGCESTGLCYVMHNWFVGTVSMMWRGSEGPLRERVEQILQLLKDGALASGPFSEAASFGFYSSQVKAERVDGGYRVNGRKIFWSNQPGTTLLTTSAERDEETLLMFLGPLSETTGVKPMNDWDTLGMRATASNSAVYEDAFFPEKWVWELPNHFYGGPISAIGGTWFAAGVAAVYAGIAQAARDHAVEWAKSGRTKFPFPGGKKPEPLAQMPHAQFLVAEMDVLLQAMDGMLRTTNLDRELDPVWTDATMVEAWRMKHFVTQTAVQVVEKSLSLVGGSGYFKKSPMERWYRSVRAGEFHPLNWGDLSAYSGKMAFGLDPHVQPRFL